MSENMVLVNGVDTVSTSTQPIHINIHVHQESALEQLIKMGVSLKEYFTRPRPANARIGHVQLSMGVVQILLGVMSCVLGTFLYIGPWTLLSGSGCAFWAGAVAIAAGTGVIVHEKHRGKCSGCMSILLTSVCVASAIAATVLCVHSLAWESDNFQMETVCGQSDPEPFFTTSPPRRWKYYNNYDNQDWKVERCKNFMKMVVKTFIGIRALLLAIYVLQAAVAWISLGMGIRIMFSRSSLSLDQEEVEKSLLGQNSVPPSPTKEKIAATIVL